MCFHVILAYEEKKNDNCLIYKINISEKKKIKHADLLQKRIFGRKESKIYIDSHPII